MPAYSPSVIRNAIKSLLQGEIGAVRTVPFGVFKYGIYEGQPGGATRAAVINPNYKHRFDVRLGGMVMHGSTPVSNNGPRKNVFVPVTIDIKTTLKATPLDDAREDQRVLADANAQLALQALERPGNLSTDNADNDTGIVSGILVGENGNGHPTWTVVEENWQTLIHHGQIRGSVIVVIDQPTST
jgi:hypothetical protein